MFLHAIESAPITSDHVYDRCSQYLVLNSRLSSYRLMPMASFTELIHLIYGLPLFLLPSISPSITVWEIRCAQGRIASVLSFLPPVMFQAQSSLGPTFSSLWQFRVSLMLSSNTTYQINSFFSYQPFSLSNFCICT